MLKVTIASCVVLVYVVVTGPLAPGEAQGQERGFVDLYGGATRLFEADVPTWQLADTSPVVGARFGVWLGQNWAVTLRTWYFQTDAREEGGLSPSDLAFLGVSLELLGRWPLGDRWALYGSLGPSLAVNTLDVQIDRATRREDDARSVAVGASGAVGVEFRVVRSLKAFVEAQTSFVYPSFDLQDRTISPRLVNIYGLTGLRLAF
jgi:hypothetical protein